MALLIYSWREKFFNEKPPSLRDLVNQHIMGDVWIRDTPYGPVTDSLKIAEKLELFVKI
jgi:hypothetical protein